MVGLSILHPVGVSHWGHEQGRHPTKHTLPQKEEVLQLPGYRKLTPKFVQNDAHAPVACTATSHHCSSIAQERTENETITSN